MQTQAEMKTTPRLAIQVMIAAGLPEPQAEFRFHPLRRWRFDYAWPAALVALEVEGGIWIGGRHNRGSGFTLDMDKYNTAALIGWRVFRTTPSLLLSTENLARLRLALGSGNAR